MDARSIFISFDFPVTDLQTAITKHNLELIRFSFCDQHGLLRGKTLVAKYAVAAMQSGVPMVGTLLLKDSSSRTAFPTFDANTFGALIARNPSLASFANAADVLMMPDASTFKVLPWASNTGWVQCQAHGTAGALLPFDSRGVLQAALAKLAKRGFKMRCGLEVEFHIYKIESSHLSPEQSAWPAPPPSVSMIHPGNNVLCEQWADMSDAPMRIVLQTAQALGLPIRSLEVELGPSQVEVVFDVQDALAAADSMVLFRNATKQALRRAGYHATFMCRPKFPNIVSSGWHLHQSLVDATTAANVFADNGLSKLGQHYLAGLLMHAKAMTPFAVPTLNGYARYQPNMMAPQRAIWGSGSRGAAFRVIEHQGAAATRIENRMGEPAANPYLYIASQIYAGLDGIERALKLPPADESPYAAGDGSDALPNSLASALAALNADPCLIDGFGADFVHYFTHIKQHEIARFEAAKAASQLDWEQREYFDLF
ncbi:MAG: glutamine synthetase [Betaproteobacteria bacterium]|nr:MAG: glutamine synthetase [Betaproteobacteria bacterium]